MKSIKHYLNNPYLWGACTVLASSLMIVGWARTYPVNYSPDEAPILNIVSPLLWVGLCGGFIGLAGLVLTSGSRYVHWLSSCLFVLLLTAPQFLYLTWGADAGALANMVDYIQSIGNFNFQRDVAVISYFQWPLSIFFHQFLADALQINVYATCQIGYIFVIISVGAGLFALWLNPTSYPPHTTRAIFWGIVVYFVGFYWFFNWQIAPYAFSLALFIPTLALLDKQTWQHKIVLFLLFGAGIESHALFGVWAIIIVAGTLVFAVGLRERHRTITLSLALLFIVVQISIIIYKNIRFFNMMMFSLVGYYEAIALIGRSDRDLTFQAQGALSSLPSDLVGTILKSISWLDLGFVGVTFAIAALAIIINRRLKIREIALFGTGLIYLLIGTQYEAIGTRALQLMAFAPAFFVIDTLIHKGKVRQVVLTLSFISLLLFPAAIMRNYQISGNFVKPVNVYLTEFMKEHRQSFSKPFTILDEGRLSNYFNPDVHIYNPYIVNDWGCQGPYIIVDTPQYRSYVELVNKRRGSPEDIQSRLNNLAAATSAIYSNGSMTLRVGQECRELKWMWK